MRELWPVITFDKDDAHLPLQQDDIGLDWDTINLAPRCVDGECAAALGGAFVSD